MSNEDKLQQGCVDWFRLAHPSYKQLLIHIPNGGSRNIIEAVKFKRIGVLSGVADLALFLPKGKYHGLFIELKTPKGRVSINQKGWGTQVKMAGYEWKVIRTFDEFKELIEWYLSL